MEDKNRSQILNDFTPNILIEAGAGSGKTTILVNRILNQIKNTEITLDKMVAITFTEKAAIGLQERFQENLFKAHTQAEGEQKEKLKRAIEDMDKIHISTIHSFCSSMLKEMPFEAGLSLDFTIVRDDEDAVFKKGLFAQFCENDQTAFDPEISEIKSRMGEVGINPDILEDTFYSICEKDGITWVYDQDSLAKDPQDFFLKARQILKQVCEVLNKQDDPAIGFTEIELKRGGTLTDDETPVIKDNTRSVYKWFTQNEKAKPSSDYMEMLEKLDEKLIVCAGKNDKNKNFNPDLLNIGKSVNNRLKKDYQLDQICAELKEDYSRYRHALCMRFLIGAFNYFNAEKKKEKKLTYKDLLVLARDMIKQSEIARQFFSHKYTCFYIDEFQDTDPIQTELIFYLACRETTLPENWEDCQLKDGTLCMVGDPKQSIFAFTGADIKLYNRVKEKMQQDSNCRVYGLQRNYRSNKQICDWVENSYSKKLSGFGFPDQTEDGTSQAIFEGMTTLTPECIADHQTLKGVYRYQLGEGTKDELIERDAPYIAELIAGLIANQAQISRYDTATKTTSTRAVTPGDFMIITWFTTSMPRYINALKEKGIPVSVEGKIETKALEEVNNLVLLLSYLDDYRNSYRLALVIEKLFACHLEADQRFIYHHIIWNEEEIQALADIRIKESLLKIRKLLMLIGQVPPMVVVETVVNDFKTIMANKEYDIINLNSAMGNVEQLLEVVRAEPYSTFSDIVARLQSLTENTLDREMSITDLIEEDGEYNAVRIMNLHKAKGLEGNVILLADPSTGVSGFPDTMLFIEDDGIKKGFIIPKDKYGSYIGKPDGWNEAKAISDALKREEQLRLLYVASTRAKEALIVASGGRVDSRGRVARNTAWKELEPLIACPQETKQICDGMLDYPGVAENIINHEKDQLKHWGIVDIHSEFIKHQLDFNARCEEAQKPVAGHINPSKFLNHLASNCDEDPEPLSEQESVNKPLRGNLYGIIIHKLFQLLVDGRYSKIADLSEAELEMIMKKSILEGMGSEQLTKKQCDLLKIDSSLELAPFIEQLSAVYDALHEDLRLKAENLCQDQEFWNRIDQADAVYTELPFQLQVKSEKASELVNLLNLAEVVKIKPLYMRGIIDLVIVKDNDYTIIDYKTNARGEMEDLGIFKQNLEAIYKPQLDLYELALKEMVGEKNVDTRIYSLYN
ncbi:MAG: hypothetical protein PWP56_1156 [Acetobacterium sp.]|nr:hypothetical protein [Acetobacterium sp.]